MERKPNALLVEEVVNLTAGTALDLGCGHGGDAIWFARQGWQVTAVDVSASALALAADHAAAAGVAEAIDWERHDLAVSFPSGSFDLVSACYLHSPVEMPREQVLRSAAAAVAPGGTLLVAGHAGSPSWSDHAPQSTSRRPRKCSTTWSSRRGSGRSSAASSSRSSYRIRTGSLPRHPTTS